MAARYPAEAVDFADGLTVEGGDWWFNLRPSNTEPLLRLNVEAATEAEMARVRDDVLEAVGVASRPERPEGGSPRWP